MGIPYVYIKCLLEEVFERIGHWLACELDPSSRDSSSPAFSME